MHNRPSGDPKPSRDDIEMTREIKAAGNCQTNSGPHPEGRVQTECKSSQFKLS